MASKSSPLAFLPSPLPIVGNENSPPVSPTQITSLETTASPLVRPSISAQAGLRRTPDTSSSNGHFPSCTSPNHHSAVKSSSNPVSRPSLSSPLLPSLKLSATSSNIIPTSFVDQSRAFLEQQRHVFEQERSLFAQERELWETERQALYERIRELELALEGTDGSGRKMPEFGMGRPSVDSVSMFGQRNHRGTFGNSGSSGSIGKQLGLNDTGEKFWEGSSHKSSATRTFSPPPKPEEGRLHSISESESINPGEGVEQLDPRDRKGSESSVHFVEPKPNTVGNGIDISLIEKGLDGISLKASSLPPAILAKVRSPSPESPGVCSPSSGRNSSSISPGGLFNLRKDAGHTPPASGYFNVEGSDQATPKQPENLHRPSVAHPLSADLPPDSPEETDPALAAPLGITNNDKEDTAFLNQLDSKLLQEARKMVFSPSEASSSPDDEIASSDPRHQPEPEIKIRFKRSMNFGSAFGSTGFGAR